MIGVGRTAVAVCSAFAIGTGAAMAQVTGPSSSQTPYIVPTAPGWEVTSLITVGDRAKEVPYRMVGIPDGLGALAGKSEKGRYIAHQAFMTVFMNHELGATSGIPRAHGTPGAFVSQWTIHLDTLQVSSGEDLIRRVYTWVGGTYVDSTHGTSFGRFCSADLPARTAFYDPKSGKGFKGRIYMNGEEIGNEGRAFAHIVSGAEKGNSYELPYLGKFSRENSLAHPRADEKTIVVGLDDSTPGQVYVYVGDKSRDGNPVERAGLAGGKLFGVKVTNGGANYGGGAVTHENNGAVNGSFTLAELADVAFKTGAQIQADSVAAGITEFARPEDGHWDTHNPNVFYFVTTGAAIDKQEQTSRLYELTFDSLANPAGGSIALVKDTESMVGTDGQGAQMFDNITVDRDGHVMLQEDPGNKAYIAKTWRIDPASGEAVQIFESDRSRFLPGGAQFLTQDEESSGIIEVTRLVRSARWYQPGRRYYLGVMQAHYPIPGELVEGGQLYLIASPPSGRDHGDDDDRDDERDED
jgi:hypothetical protein